MNLTDDSALEGVNRPLWWTGWRPIATPVVGGVAGLVVGNAVAIPLLVLVGLHPLLTMAVATFVGLCAGIGGWYWGTREVNRRFRAVLDGYRSGRSPPRADETTYVLLTDGDGTKPLVTPYRHYDTCSVVLRDSSLVLASGHLDVSTRRLTVADDATVIPYESLARVSFEGSTLALRTTDGTEFRYESLSDPHALLRDLRSRLPSAD